jgi:hypothetical protein
MAMVMRVNGALLVSHSGSANPTTESPAWLAGGGNSQQLAVGPVNDGGVDCWQIADTSLTAYRNYSISLPSNSITDPSGWTFTAYVRVVSHGNANGGLGVALGVADTQRQNLLDLVGTSSDSTNNGIWFWNTGGTETKFYAMDTTSAFHTYQLIFNPSQSDRIGIYVDGGPVGQILRSSFRASSPGGQNIFPGWGSGSPDTSTSNWAYIAFETGQHVQVIPESASLIACICSTALLRRNRGWRIP